MLDLTHSEFETVIREAVTLGKKNERDRIIKLLEDRLIGAQETKQANGQITAMRVPVDYDQLEAVIEACIYAIKGENK